MSLPLSALLPVVRGARTGPVPATWTDYATFSRPDAGQGNEDLVELLQLITVEGASYLSTQTYIYFWDLPNLIPNNDTMFRCVFTDAWYNGSPGHRTPDNPFVSFAWTGARWHSLDISGTRPEGIWIGHDRIGGRNRPFINLSRGAGSITRLHIGTGEANLAARGITLQSLGPVTPPRQVFFVGDTLTGNPRGAPVRGGAGVVDTTWTIPSSGIYYLHVISLNTNTIVRPVDYFTSIPQSFLTDGTSFTLTGLGRVNGGPFMATIVGGRLSFRKFQDNGQWIHSFEILQQPD